MAFFGDMQAAVVDYPSIALTLTFEDISLEDGTTGAINVNEVWGFRVRVANSGALDMTDVTLHLQGINGARISSSPTGPWTTLLVSNSFNVPAHTGSRTARHYFKAPAEETTGVKSLLGAHVAAWNASLRSILEDRSGHSAAPVGTYAAEVHP